MEQTTQHEKSFAQGMNFYKLFWVFFLGCFLGVVVETIYCLVTKGVYESRQGLIYGPFNLVYGFGAFFMTIGLGWIKKHRLLWVFVGGILIGDVFEYFCSWIQETMFGTVSWQYDHLAMSINGRISLKFSIFWGALALVWIFLIYPLLSKQIERIPDRIGVGLTWVLVVFMVFNTLMSGLATYRMAERRDSLPASNRVEHFLDQHYPDERMKEIYPNMMVVEE